MLFDKETTANSFSEKGGNLPQSAQGTVCAEWSSKEAFHKGLCVCLLAQRIGFFLTVSHHLICWEARKTERSPY